MDLSIKKDVRGHKFHQRGIRNGEVSKTKTIALKDITNECGSDNLYERNYVAMESIIMDYMQLNISIISI